MGTATVVLSQTQIERSASHTLNIYWKEAKYELLKNLRLRVYTLSVISFPVMFYVLFGLAVYAKAGIDGVGMPTYLIESEEATPRRLSDADSRVADVPKKRRGHDQKGTRNSD